MGMFNAGGGGGFLGGMTSGMQSIQALQQQRAYMDLLKRLRQAPELPMQVIQPPSELPMQVIQPPSMQLVPGEDEGQDWAWMPGLSQGPMQGPLLPRGGVPLRNRMMGFWRR